MNTTLASELLAIAREQDMAANPFVAGVRNGDYPREALGLYATQLHAAASRLPRILSAILGWCDDPRIRRSLIGNLLEEEGVARFAAGQAVEIDPERRHAAHAQRFVDATGATASAREEDLSSSWIVHSLRRGDWISPLAFITIGHEANVPRTFSLLVPALRANYGFNDEELVFFTEHITADEHHGAEGAAMVAAAAETRGMADRAVEGTRRGARSWWAFYSRFDRQLRALNR